MSFKVCGTTHSINDSLLSTTKIYLHTYSLQVSKVAQCGESDAVRVDARLDATVAMNLVLRYHAVLPTYLVDLNNN